MAVCSKCGCDYTCRSDSIEAYDPEGNCVSSSEDYDGPVEWGQLCRSCQCPQCQEGPEIGPDAIRINMDKVVPY